MDVSTCGVPTIRSKLGDVDVVTPARPQGDGKGITFRELVQELHAIFSGDCVNVEHINELFASYESNPAEWKPYAKFDPFKYTRNLVDAGNGKFNLMVICWGEGHGSSTHDHSNSHCFMKVLSGALSEVRFAWPNESESENVEEDCEGYPDDVTPNELQEISRTTLNTNEVSYMNDSLGLHRVENYSHTEAAVSLHLYCPPFDTCNTFNQKTGKRTPAKVTFWSKYGERPKKDEGIASRVPEDN